MDAKALETEAKSRIDAAVADRDTALRHAELHRSLSEDSVDITLPGTPVARGHLHLITQVRREVEDIFLGMGYQVVEGREIETTRYLFDALNMSPTHPTRSPLHSLYLT